MKDSNSYIILPFNFLTFQDDLILLVNMVGEYLFASRREFGKLTSYGLDRKVDSICPILKAKHFIAESTNDPAIDLLAVKYRTKKDFLSHFTSLHMIEVTRRCNQRCIYCQASSQDLDKSYFDMNEETARKVVDIILMSPAKSIKIEFQGGEPLLNFEAIKQVIDYVSKQASSRDKEIEYVVCTNLTLVTDEMLKYLADQHVLISTSLDGPENVHNSCRRYCNGGGTYKDFAKALERTEKYITLSRISALMTTTRFSLDYPEEIVNEYVRNGFSSLFIRPLNPFGYAIQKVGEIGYGPAEFVRFYKRILDHVLKINREGTFFEESFASLLLTRILTPFCTGFVDLQFPAGTGISGVMYGYDGNVYISDEARMLAYTGDLRFCMGNVHRNSYRELFYNNSLVDIIEKSCAESTPGCAECAFQMYCGTDPVRNYAIQGDIVGHRPTSESCLVNWQILKHLFEIVHANTPDQMDILWSWITGRSLSEIRFGAEC